MSFNEFFDMFLGPLNSNYCNLFLIFAIISLITLALAVISLLGTLMYSKPTTWFTKITAALAAQFFSIIFYFQNRLLYGMCVKTL